MSRTIRLAGPADTDSLGEVFRRSSLSNDGDRAALLANPDVLVFDDAGVREQRTRVAVAGDGRILGLSTIRVAATVAELEDLFVDPDCMRRGVGSELVRDAAATARAHGAERIEVTANEHAREFYEAVGFVVDGITQTRFAPALRMHLDLASE
jgi:GNAT superfamily N-acetyltransferase